MAFALRRALPRFSSRRPLSNISGSKKQQFCCLDLRNSGLSVIERLCLEECILRHDSRQWIIWGTHDPIKSRYLTIPSLPSYIQENSKLDLRHEDPCIIVMGIGGKPELLLNIDKVKEHGVWVIKRFSGGGTVVVDRNCLYTTIIGRNDQLAHVPPYPREIMDWTATEVFGPTFKSLKQRAIQKHPSYYPDFELRENDYVLGSTQKVAGNAQSIVKTGFLHHTTFLWTYEEENMKYLTLPAKRPEYRSERSHSKFLIQLKHAYQSQLEMGSFFDSLESVCRDSFEIEEMALDQALSIVTDVVGEGGIQAFYEKKSRTRLIEVSAS